MFRTLTIGFVLGLVASIAAVYFVPVVDQHREASVIAVAPNGGNMEAFYVSIPMDRIMVGAPNQAEPLPPGLNWPSDEKFAGVRTEVFKLRNAREVVVGVASRVAVENDDYGNSIEWVIHLPARGTFYASISPQSSDGASRRGVLKAGTREFRTLKGAVSERWIAGEEQREEDAPDGQIELMTFFVGEFADDGSAGDIVEGAL